MTDTIKTWQERTTHCEAPRHHDFYSCMMQAEIDELRVALEQQAEQGWQPTNAAMDALRRFQETCADNEGYDVPKDTVRNLCAIGLIYHTHRDRYCITDFGNHMLAAVPKA